MAEKDKKIKEPYLITPDHILKTKSISLSEKFLLSHIYSFGLKGCWESNETMGEFLNIGERSISRWITNLKKKGLVFWVHPKGRFRTLWAKTHPDVKSANTLYYMGEKINKEAVINGHAAEILLGQNCLGGIDKSVVPTETNQCVQVRQNCLHTNNTTNKDTIERTIERPPPLPAGGQSSAALDYRKKAQKEVIENLKGTFGNSKKGNYIPLVGDKFENERQRQLKSLHGQN